MRTVYSLIYRSIVLGLVALMCAFLASKFRPWTATGCAAGVLLAVCGVIGAGMRMQKPGKVTIVNYLGGTVLAWGYRIGRGKLLPIVLESWLRWTLMAAAILFLIGRSRAPFHPSAATSVVLLLSWIIMGASVLRLIAFLLTRGNSNPIPPGTFGPIFGMIGLMSGSVALVALGKTDATIHLAVLLTAGPIVVIAGGYGLMLAVMMVFGRNMRWN